VALREYPGIKDKVSDVIYDLRYKHLYNLMRRHRGYMYEQKEDLDKLMADLEEIAANAEVRFSEGGYTVFVYNVLLGVLDGLFGVLLDLSRWIGEFERGTLPDKDYVGYFGDED
jgi:hypothetical protein